MQKPEEKGSDVNLAVRLVADAYEDLYDTALVVSGDSDLQLAVDIVAKKLGKRVLVCDPHARKSRALVSAEKRTIGTSALASCQMPIPVINENGLKIFPPASWK